MRSLTRSRSGFTLIELSIVLVILAIAAGGILIGVEILRAARIRSVLNENEVYTQSLRTFKDRYKFYPGDFPGARRLWGELDADEADCIITESERGSTATCDGNGDGVIGGIGTGSYATNSAQLYEMFRAWQHLANAELLTGYFTGVPYASAAVTAYASAPLRDENSAAVFGQNAPQSAFRTGTGWNIGTVWGLYNSCNNDPGEGLDGNVLVFASHASGETFSIGMSDGAENLLTPQEAKSIDTKVDDDLPSSGNLQSIGLQCPTDCTPGADYDLQNKESVCGLVYVRQF